MGDEASYLEDGADYIEGECTGECTYCECVDECPDADI